MQRSDVPVAAAIADLAASLHGRPVAAFVCYWIAFANLCQVLARSNGVKAHFGLRQNGTLRMHKLGGLTMAEVYPPRWEQQMDSAFASLSEDLRHRLVSHPNVRFLVFRVPEIDGKPLRQDAHHQHPNGILDAGCTLDARYPVWSPIDLELYRHYVGGQQSPEVRDTLARQILSALWTLYRNLEGAGVDRAEAGDVLVAQALPLLELVVVESLGSLAT